MMAPFSEIVASRVSKEIRGETGVDDYELWKRYHSEVYDKFEGILIGYGKTESPDIKLSNFLKICKPVVDKELGYKPSFYHVWGQGQSLYLFQLLEVKVKELQKRGININNLREEHIELATGSPLNWIRHLGGITTELLAIEGEQILQGEDRLIFMLDMVAMDEKDRIYPALLEMKRRQDEILWEE